MLDHTVQVPSGCRNLKVQAWGGGGGSGHFRGGQCGEGGGGAFAEAILHVTPDEELEVKKTDTQGCRHTFRTFCRCGRSLFGYWCIGRKSQRITAL